MEDDKVIQVQHVTKTYKLYEKHTDRVKEAFHPFRKRYNTSFNALSDVSLDVKKGDTVGIIGRNGSGKSTILQLICGILTPTEGNLIVDGRISALLELGAGFNPEFTGRENVYLNASILGLEKKEIDDCFDQIADFADIGEFIEQPVKSYSTGMYVRLAFAVAINVNPDILIVDEALSVGDTLFQSKCYAKFREFQDKGVTILFVTHALDLITRYCSQAFLFEKGHLCSTGNAKAVVDEYNRLLADCNKKKKSEPKDAVEGISPIHDLKHDAEDWELLFHINPDENRYGNGRATIIGAGMFSIDGQAMQTLFTGEEYEFCMKIRFNAEVKKPIFSYTIKDVKGFDISGTNTLFQDMETGNYQKGDQVLITFKHKMLLSSGGYLLSFGCAGYEDGEYIIYERRYDYMSFEIISDKSNVGFIDLHSQISLKMV
jgi:ABC-type polysaccharide/polyol phosphate transport system ATPase subunit